MARATLHARVGNPNNLGSLPATRPVLRFRTDVFPFRENAKKTLLVLGFAILAGAVALVTSLVAAITSGNSTYYVMLYGYLAVLMLLQSTLT